jgi:hypothetical protein
MEAGASYARSLNLTLTRSDDDDDAFFFLLRVGKVLD